MMNIFITNLGKYNEGHLVGEWVKLPATSEELEAVYNRIGINAEYEEMFITDYECDITGLEIGEYTNIEQLNTVAKLLDDCDNREAVEAYIGYNGSSNMTMLEIANIIAQADEISFFSYEFEGIQYCENDSNEEKIGRTLAELNGITQMLEEKNIECYFNFERYGESEGNDFYLTDNGYLDLRCDIDGDFYSWDELKEL
jgi:hypothetical protein